MAALLLCSFPELRLLFVKSDTNSCSILFGVIFLGLSSHILILFAFFFKSSYSSSVTLILISFIVISPFGLNEVKGGNAALFRYTSFSI